MYFLSLAREGRLSVGLETRLGGERQIMEQGGGRKERRDSLVPRLSFFFHKKEPGHEVKEGVVEQLAT